MPMLDLYPSKIDIIDLGEISMQAVKYYQCDHYPLLLESLSFSFLVFLILSLQSSALLPPKMALSENVDPQQHCCCGANLDSLTYAYVYANSKHFGTVLITHPWEELFDKMTTFFMIF